MLRYNQNIAIAGGYSNLGSSNNRDGSPLTDLAGYKLYYGTSSGVYGTNLDIGVISHISCLILRMVSYYLAVTAYDTSGNESTSMRLALGTVR